MVASLSIVSRSREQTRLLGEGLGRLAEVGDVFLLTGGLGAGKTTLTQGIAEGLEVREYTRSPTFTLVNEYHGRMPLYHVDLYRVETPEEIMDLGLEEYLYGRGLAVIEWADRATFLWPEQYLLIELAYVSVNRRQIGLSAVGPRYERILDGLPNNPALPLMHARLV